MQDQDRYQGLGAARADHSAEGRSAGAADAAPGSVLVGAPAAQASPPAGPEVPAARSQAEPEPVHTSPQPGVPHPQGQAADPAPATRRTRAEGEPGEPVDAYRVPGLGGGDPDSASRRTRGEGQLGEPVDAHRVPGPGGADSGPAGRRTPGVGQADHSAPAGRRPRGEDVPADPGPAARRPRGEDLPGEPADTYRVPGPGEADPGPATRRPRGEDLPADPGPAGRRTRGEGQAGDPAPAGRPARGEGTTAGPADAHRVPGPGVAGIVAQAVARGLGEGEVPEVARLRPVPRGSAVTEVPVHLPFRGAPQPGQQPPPQPAPKQGPAPRPTAVTRPAPGRRVPRGDHRLREHRGPVLPGWVGVAVGGTALAGCAAVLWRAGAVPDPFLAAFGAAPRAYRGLRATHWPPLAFLGIVALIALGGLGRVRAGHAWVLTLFGRYRGTVRRTGLTWVSPLLLRRRVDVRLRHWRSDPMPAVDSGGLALQVVVQVVWQVKDTARATLAVADHTEYLAEQVESAMARVLSQLPADAFHEDAPTLRDAEAVGDALTRMLAAETEAVGIEVFSAQPTRIEYAAEVAEAMRRRRVAAIDAKHRDTVLTSIVDAVDDTVHRLTSRGLVELDDYERKALVKDLTVAFYTGRCE
ncbi:SPFH domain-containing protein [Streptomyces sp. NPDC016562]|uniref:SPFH domain-containing protein n=1 Tax=Streptomyces sp. NPDC016562 TaxID=3364966 RepID=UPI0036F89F0A